MRRLLAACLALLLSLPLSAAPVLQRQLGPVREYRLDNGLQLLLIPTTTASGRSIVTLTYRVGSRHEGEGEAGLAHLLEHMTFRGVAGHEDLGLALQALGVRFNGTTSADRTNYSAIFGRDAAVLQQVLALEAARMRSALLREADLAKEKPLVLNEMALRGASLPLQLLHAAQRTMFRSHPYGRPVIGYVSEIEALSMSRLRAFYERHYRPDNAVLTIAGDFDAEAALLAAEQTLGAVPRPAQALVELTLAAEPAQQRPRLGTVPGLHTGLALAYRVPGMAHADTAALALLGTLLLDETQSRLIERGTPFTAAPLAPLLPVSRDPYLLGLGLSLPTLGGEGAEALEALGKLEQRWFERAEGIADSKGFEQRVRLLRSRLAAAMLQQLGDPETSSRLLSEAIAAGDWRLPLRLADELMRVEPAAVRRAAAEYLRAENRVMVRALSEPGVAAELQIEELPVGGFWARLFSRAAKVDAVSDPSSGLDRLRQRAAPAPATPAAPASAASAAAAELPQGAQRRRIAGLRVASQALPGEMSSLLLELRWGNARELADETAQFAMAALLQDTPAEQRNRLFALQAQLRFVTTAQSVMLQLQAPKRSLIPALEIAVELMRKPAWREDSLARLRQGQLAQLASLQRHPAAVPQERFRQLVEQQLGTDALERPRGAEEMRRIWQALSLQRLRAWHERWWSANEGRLAVVGALPENLDAALERLFGSWQNAGAGAYEAQPLVHRDVGAGRLSGAVAAGESGRVLWQQWLPARGDDADLPALMLGLLALAGDGSAIGNRLADRLRGREALSYAVGMQLELPRDGLAGLGSTRALLRVQASGPADRLAAVEVALPEELLRLQREGLGAEELERLRQRLLTQRRLQLRNPGGLVVALMQQLDDPDWAAPRPLDEMERRLLAVQPEQVRQALGRLRADGFLVLVLGAAAP